MKDQRKTKAQLIDELEAARSRIEELEAATANVKINVQDEASELKRNIDITPRKQVEEELKLTREQLEERLGDYLRAMRRLHLIAFPEWDEPR